MNALQPLEATAPDVARWVSVLAPARQLAEVLAGTEFVPKAMRNKPDQVCAAILYGDELGLGPMQALAGLDVVEGKPRPSAELARALILRDGHTITVHEATGTRVRVSGLRAGRPESERVTVEWTTDMARAAGLLNKTNWRSYPRAMLMARATGDLARILFPDVIKGLGYVAETAAVAADLDAWAPPGDDAPEPEKPKRPAIGRKRPTATTDLPDDATAPQAGAPDASRRPSVVDPEAPDVAPRVDLPPESTPEPDPDGEPGYRPDDARPMRETQRRGMFAAIGRILGPEEGTRDVRLALVSAVVNREVESSNDLTQAEATRVLSWLDDLDHGRVSFVYDDDRKSARVFTVEPKPPDPWPDDSPSDPWADIGGTS